MRIKLLLPLDSIITIQITSLAKREVIEEQTHALASRYPHLDPVHLFQCVWEREVLLSTAIGKGVAIPHGKLNGLQRFYLCFGRSAGGVDFDAPDCIRVHYSLTLIAPDGCQRTYLEVLAGLARRLKIDSLRKQLWLVKAPTDLHSLLTAKIPVERCGFQGSLAGWNNDSVGRIGFSDRH